MKNYLTLLCLSNIQDVTTGLSTFVNCIENGVVNSVPETLPGFIVVSKWTCSKKATGLTASVICHRPDGSEDTLHIIKGIHAEKGNLTIAIQLEFIEIKDAGTHYIQVKLHEGDQDFCFGHKYPISITLRKKP